MELIDNVNRTLKEDLTITIRARVDLLKQIMQSYIHQENRHARKKHENERNKEEKPYSIERRIAETLWSLMFFVQ